MLPLILALLVDPEAAAAVRPKPAPPPVIQPQTYRFRVRGDCENPRIRQAGPALTTDTPRPVLTDLMHRDGDPVRVDLLLDRRIDGCSAPLTTVIAPFARRRSLSEREPAPE